MPEAFICDAVRTPFGRYGGALAAVRPDDLAAVPIRALLDRNPGLDPAAIEEVVLGCANQAGEDNRNVARMAALLAGLPVEVPGTTVNRLCGSGMDAVGMAARAIKAGEIGLAVAGGVESMSRAPFVVPKAEAPFSRSASIEDTTIGWRLVNPLMRERYGIDSMPETAENVAEEFRISREDQDAFALRSQQRAAAAIGAGRLEREIVPVMIPRRKGEPLSRRARRAPAARDHTRRPGQAARPVPQGRQRDGRQRVGGQRRCVRAGRGVGGGGTAARARAAGAGGRDGDRGRAAAGHGHRARCRRAARRSALAGLDLDRIDLVELNEAFASQALACLRQLGLPDDAERVNPDGGAIALGHPLGASGARLLTHAAHELRRRNARYALCTMCIGVGQGIATVIERA